MKNNLTTGAWQHNIGCPIKIVLVSTSDVHRRTLSHATDFNCNGLNDLPLVRELCLVPMTDFDHDRSQVTNRNKPKEIAAQMRHRENALP